MDKPFLGGRSTCKFEGFSQSDEEADLDWGYFVAFSEPHVSGFFSGGPLSWP